MLNIKPFIPGLLLAALIIAFSAGSSLAQIKIGTNGATIAPASLLELESANQGLLLPRMADTAAINALNPPNGMLIYLTKAPAVGLYVRKVTGWEYLTGSLGGNGNFNSLTVAGTITAGNFSGPLNGNATSANTSITSTNSLNSAVINDLATGQPTYPIFVTQTPGNAQLRTSTTKLSFVPNTGILTAVGFTGPLVGDVTGNASSATNATNASNTDISDDVSTNAVHYPTFVSGTTGNLPHRTSSTNLSYTPQTGELKAVRFLGNLIGNASSSDNAITTTITNDNISGATVYPTFVTNTSGNWGQRTAGTKLSFVPSTGILTAGGFTSTIPDGTAPLIVASSTPVANLTATNTLFSAIRNDIATTTTAYPTFVLDAIGYQNHRVADSKLSFIPSTGVLTASGFNGPLNGNANTATSAGTTTITDDITTAVTTYPTFVTNTTGNLNQRTSSSRLNFVPSTGVLTANAFTSTVPTGVAPLVVASTTTVANLSVTNTLNTNITEDVATTAPVYPTFVTATSGNQSQRVASSRLSFIPSTGALTASSFVGPLTGNATSATSAINASTVTTIPTLLGEVTNSGNTVTLSNAAVISKLVGSTYSTATTPVSATDNIIQAIGKVEGNSNLKAPINNPSFTGTVVIPTPYTLGATTVTTTGTQLNYLNIATGVTGTSNVVLSNSPIFTGTPTLPTGTIGITQIAGNNSTALATTAFVTTADALKANIASPTFTGTVTFPTPFTLGGASVTSTGAQINFLNAATGTTGTSSSNVVFSASPTLTTPILGVATVSSIRGNSTTPTKVNGVGITASTVAGTNLSGSIEITSDASGATNAVLLTITYAGLTFPTNSYPVLVPANPLTAALVDGNKIYVIGNPGNFQIMSGTTTLPAGVYKWYYMVSGN
ncbi:hypothetical protein SAMN05421813_13043 [Daejeonella rubra]|uniref:Uncharacterized protein n=1 Tax=Daejeonella rubra TaxID=990371 RepID=A0A1G9XGU6_9SPHI|nr:hypothetical protein [Daejeonella rubra]SDM95751.1 hypothetical protein SAMN05421813_13043 [Daejeonella rubra]